MTRSEAERLAVLETNVEHMTEGMAELKRAVADLVSSNVITQQKIDGWDNRLKGGKAVIVGALSLATACGGFFVWIWQHIPWK